MKLIILDRDGVINQDSDHYIKSPHEWHPIPGSIEAIASLNSAGWTVAVATNQSGVARGLFDSHTLDLIHQSMYMQLKKSNAKIDYLVCCKHGPDDNCNCRKPRSGMYQRIAFKFDCSLLNVPVVGDSKRDLDAAVAVGAQPILVKTGKGERSIAAGSLPSETIIFADLQEAVNSLLALYADSMGQSR